jgi:hypothetical protein
MKRNQFGLVLALALCVTGSLLRADEGTAPAATPIEASTDAPSKWTIEGLLHDTSFGKWLKEKRVGVTGHVEMGVTGNPDDPKSDINFGHLFTDRANQFDLNQALLTIERPLAPEEGKWDWGFKLQPMYGSDARYTHLMYFLDDYSNDYYEFDIVEMYANAHLPYVTKGGIDLKGGIFVTLMGAEVIYAPGNPFYSHSYIFNYGIPLKHWGGMITMHATDQIDLHVGGVTGINTSWTDNNDNPAFHCGASWKSKNEKAFVFASFHYGPENDTQYEKPGFGGVDANSDCRYIGDLVLTFKPLEKLTLITDLNYGKDDGFDAEWYGGAQYAIYEVCKWLKAGIRGEVFRDDDAFAVVQFHENDDFLDLQRGRPTRPQTVSGGDTTYYELTTGVTISPCDSVAFRPELRWDWSDGDTDPYDNFHKSHQFTLAMDMIIKF